MRTLDNKKLTRNFWLWEFIEANLPIETIKLNWEHIKEFSEERCIQIAILIQGKRDHINEVFRDKNGGKEITFIITSGFRCKAWEKIRKRDGTSQHTLSWGVDVQPGNCSAELAIEILEYLRLMEWDMPGGHKGGFAIKEPEYKDGKIEKVGFAHYDKRPTVARWHYQ